MDQNNEDQIVRYFECLEECTGKECRRICKVVFIDESVPVETETDR